MGLTEEVISGFFEFVYDRQSVYNNKTTLKLDMPWTEDEILDKYLFCNVFRHLDRGTIQYLKDIPIGKYTREETLFNTILYRFFNLKDTFPRLFDKPLTGSTFDLHYHLDRLREIKNSGGTIFSTAYLINARVMYPINTGFKHEQLLQALQELHNKIYGPDKFVDRLYRSENVDEAIEILREVNFLGPFLALQVFVDLSYHNQSKGLFDRNKCYIVGPGALPTLKTMNPEIIGTTNSKIELTLRLIWSSQNLEFNNLKERTGKDFRKVVTRDTMIDQLTPDTHLMAITDIQASMCEFRKYNGLKAGSGKKRHYKRTAPAPQLEN